MILLLILHLSFKEFYLLIVRDSTLEYKLLKAGIICEFLDVSAVPKLCGTDYSINSHYLSESAMPDTHPVLVLITSSNPHNGSILILFQVKTEQLVNLLTDLLTKNGEVGCPLFLQRGTESETDPLTPREPWSREVCTRRGQRT